MIKVEKAIDTIPDILNNKATKSKRTRLLNAKRWLSSSSYKSPYQSSDVRKSLKAIYNNKCAYCEQRIVLPKKNQNKSADNDLTVEHYRPKANYYWLAYSWDNLLPVCYGCNHEKDDDFDIEGSEIAAIRKNEIDTIHELAESYNREEQPKFIHPELEDLSTEFIYQPNGTVDSENERCRYVIEKCGLQRLSNKRKRVIDDLKSKFKAIRSEEEFYELVKIIKVKSENPKTEFVTLYRYILLNFKEIVV